MLPRATREMSLAPIRKGEAVLRLAKNRAQALLPSNADVLRHVQDFHFFRVQPDDCHELDNFGNLDGEVYVARYMGESEADPRAWIVEKFKNWPPPDSSFQFVGAG